jgi:hypothetical protein
MGGIMSDDSEMFKELDMLMDFEVFTEKEGPDLFEYIEQDEENDASGEES